jgi:hypothetical protein
MLVIHVACASVWDCAGQRHSVPRTYPGHTKSPSPGSLGATRASLVHTGARKGEGKHWTAGRVPKGEGAEPRRTRRGPKLIPHTSLALRNAIGKLLQLEELPLTR